MLVVGSRVLFGHSGDRAGFHAKSKWARFLIFLAVLAAITRATPAWWPTTTISHHVYAAWAWGGAGDPLAALAPAAFCHQGRRGLTGHSPSESA
ncbi:MAG: hypothetical protein JNJ70_23380 [Verrucomicrobiales bacterium]|nr:hypothetical protein [Verrucomicrobiales bacterium]